MFKAAEFFSLAARQKVAADSVYTVPCGFDKGGGNYSNRRNPKTHCCIVGDLLNAEGKRDGRGDAFTMPSRHQATDALGLDFYSNAAAMDALMKANDYGELTTPERVREVLGVVL